MWRVAYCYGPLRATHCTGSKLCGVCAISPVKRQSLWIVWVTTPGILCRTQKLCGVSQSRYARNLSWTTRAHVIINFTPIPVEDYHLYLDEEGIYEELLNSDDKKYGGSGVVNTGVRFNVLPSDISEHPYCVRLRLPPMAICIFKCTRKSNKKSVRPN